MFYEYALTPDIFDSASYASPELADVYLSSLKEPLLVEALVRDLRSGEWAAFIQQRVNGYHPRTKELLRKLVNQNRLRPFPSSQMPAPADAQGWCVEALESRRVEPLNGIITTNGLAQMFKNEPGVADITKLSSAAWWQARSSSVRLDRKTNAYLAHLGKILKHANSLMFIDRNLDPSKPHYGEFVRILLATTGRQVKPKIEIHRASYDGAGRNRVFPSKQEWEACFNRAMGELLRNAGVSVEVFLWDDCHDRYLITDIVGINLPYGFDVSTRPGDLTTWTRLGRADRDDIQREFDPASQRHSLRYRFIFGANA